MPDPIPTLEQILALDRAHVIHPISEFRHDLSRNTKIITGGKGVELTLADGRTVIDGFSGLFNINVGHGRTEIAEAVAAQMRDLAYYPSFWDFGNEPAARLAERVTNLLPADRGLRHFLFNNSGSEANEANFKIAKLYHSARGMPWKTKILSRRWSYHGATRSAGSATGIGAYHAMLEQDANHIYVSPPYCYRCEFKKTYPDCGLPCAADVEEVIEREGAETVAAFIVEPVMGTGGILVPPPDYFAEIAEICRRHDVLLILDEVITGFGRTGRWFGMEHWNIHPDLVSFAKGISSGYLPLSASVISDRVYDTLRDEMPPGIPFMFGLTYNNHPACCAAGLANLDIVESEGLVENARTVGAYLLEQLQTRFASSPIAGEVRGVGMLAAIEVVRDRETKEPFPNIPDAGWIANECFERGLIARALLQCVALSPPLCATTGDIDRMLEILAPVWAEAEQKFAERARPDGTQLSGFGEEDCGAMNGAESLVETLVDGGVEVCFTNPGTSEMHFVAALDRFPGMRSILTLFEGVASGAADGYGRMAEKPAATLLHTGPGLANGLANFHNARKARTPIVSIVGDHATSHRQYDAPLSADVEAFARPVSGWVRSAADARSVASDGTAALAAALQPPGRIATLILPADCAWNEADGPAAPPVLPERETAAPETIGEVAAALRSREPAVILMTGQALLERGLETASRIAGATSARLMSQTFNARLQRGAGRAPIEPLPYFAESAVAALEGTRHLILVGAQPPVSFFAYPDAPSWLTPEGCSVHTLARPEEDANAALAAVADELGATSHPPTLQEPSRTQPPTGALTPEAVHRSIAALLPEHAIVSDEAITGGFGMLYLSRGAAPHDWLQLTGGAIGQGLPLATGAAVACPDRKVICLEGDGSAMYTIQALWTQAREGLDVTNVIFANRSYAILEVELARVGAQPGPRARSNYFIGEPDLDFVKMARGLGVSAARATSADEFNDRFAAAMQTPGPHLIEVPL